MRLWGKKPPRNQRTVQGLRSVQSHGGNPSEPTERPALRQRLAASWQAWKARAEQPDLPEATPNDEVDEEEASGGGWWSALAWAAAALCIGIVALASLNLHDFQTRVESGVVSKFEVVGAKRVTPQQVEKASGVRWGSALTSIDRTAVSRAIEQLAWVRQAEVEAELPNKLRFVVREYQPYALLLGEGKMMIVDRDGFVFKQAELGEAGDLPVITGFSPALSRDALVKTLRSDETPEQRRLRSLLRLLEAHAHSPLAERFPLSEVHWDAVLGITLVSARDGAEVRLGRGIENDLSRAFGNIDRVLRQADRDGEWLRYALLDDELRPDRVVVRTEPLGAAVQAGGAAAVGLPKAATAEAKLAPLAKGAPSEPEEPAD